ncbi:MAG: diguanylate cyclase [Negativicutes bacterium]|nr:diguanylate cyclase [Negativicutes bacterium]
MNLKTQLTSWYYGDYNKFFFQKNKKTIRQENADSLCKVSAAAGLLALLMFFSTLRVVYLTNLRSSYFIFNFIFWSFALFAHAVIRKKPQYSGFALYAFMIMIYLFSYYISVINNSSSAASTFFVFQIALPILFLIPPGEAAVFSLIVTLGFCKLCFLWKPLDLAVSDTINGLASFCIGLILTYFVVNLRLKSIDRQALLEQQRDTDVQTNLPNRRKFNHIIEQTFREFHSSPRNFYVLMMDVDYFKAYNDTFGHVQGDSCLESLGIIFHQFAKENSIFLARYGGEEFVAIDTLHTKEAIERLGRQLILQTAALKISHPKSPYGIITLSAGCAGLLETQAENYMMLVNYADDALYQAKHTGRNSLVIWEKGTTRQPDLTGDGMDET